jgi:hypothetical protein
MPIKNQGIANKVAVALSNGLTHPGQDKRQATNLHFPGLDVRGKPTHMQEAIKGALQAIAEAIVHLIEQDHTIVLTSDHKVMQAELQRLHDAGESDE